ncbi:hypothetical protein D3C86_1262130 [compost metagenome]
MGGVVASHACPGAVVQAASPPPLRFTVFVPPLGPTADAATFTGIRISKVPGAMPAATLQLVVFDPEVGQPLSTPVVVPATNVGAPRRVTPGGKVSITEIGAVVVPLATVTSTE